MVSCIMWLVYQIHFITYFLTTTKRSNRIVNTPVVIVSAADANSEIPIAQSKGLNGYIAKPVNVMTLPDQISRILNGEPIWISQ